MKLEFIFGLLAFSSAWAIQLTKDNVASMCQVNETEIDCSSKNIDNITKDAFSNYGDKIVNLILNDNSIETLEPDTFATLINLKKIDLHKNKFETVPEDLFGLEKSLETLIMSSNLMLPFLDLGFLNPNKLKYLDLSENMLVLVKPSELGNLESLETLILTSCWLASPSVLFNLTNNNLKVLNMNENDLGVLKNSESFEVYSNLEELYLNKAGILFLEPTVFRSNKMLATLDLSENRILELKEGTFQNLTSLVSLRLNDNRMYFIPTFELYCLKQLQTLDLCGNKILSVNENNCNDISKLYKTWEQWYGYYPERCTGQTTTRTTVSTSTRPTESSTTSRPATTTSQGAHAVPDFYHILLVCLLIATFSA